MEVRDWTVLECQGLLDVSNVIESPPEVEKEDGEIIHGKTIDIITCISKNFFI